MFFSGTSMGTRYYRNIHTGGGICLTVQAGYLGTQGIFGGEHNGNEWYDKSLNIIPTLQAFHFPPQQAQNSRIWAHTPQSERNPNNLPGYVYFSKYHPADIGPDQMDEWFKEDATGFPGTSDCINHIVVATETDKAIAGSTIIESQLSSAHIWTGKRYLYTKLMHNPGLQDDYTEFGSFLTTESQTSVGQLYAVQQKIAEGLAVSVNLAAQLAQLKAAEGVAVTYLLVADSILDVSTDALALASANNSKNDGLGELHTLDSLYNELNTAYQAALMTKLQEALALNDVVSASNNYEQYEKTVNDLSIRQILYQNGELTATQVSTLNTIAAECPKFGGHGVYRARGLLKGCNAGNWSDNYANCYPITPLVEEQVLGNGFEERITHKPLHAEIMAYPNPAKDWIFIRLPFGTDGLIALHDLKGRNWMEVPFIQDDEQKLIDLENLPSGVYICTVANSTGERQAIKVVVVRP